MSMFGSSGESGASAHVDDNIKQEAPDGSGKEKMDISMDLAGTNEEVQESATKYKNNQVGDENGQSHQVNEDDPHCEHCDDEKNPKAGHPKA